MNNVSIEGVSGYRHTFDFLAKKCGHKMLIDVARGIFDFLASPAKRVDVPGYSFLIVVKEEDVREILPEIVERRPGALRLASVIVYSEPEDLRNKLHYFFENMVCV